MKPIIGITCNFSNDSEIGKYTHMGGKGQRWNLVAQNYIEAIELSGGIPILLPIYENIENLKSALCVCSGILFTGGYDVDCSFYGEENGGKLGLLNAERDKQEISLLKHILENSKIPTLGICRGHQLMNITCGGTLFQDLEDNNFSKHSFVEKDMNILIHKVQINKNSHLHNAVKSSIIDVNSFHHQAIDIVGTDLIITATDENGIIEGVEHKDKNRFFVGVQWHPETLVKDFTVHKDIFDLFIQKSLEYLNHN